MEVIGIIPARFASSRFPGKPLVDIAGKTMIQRVYEQASKALDDVLVATDDFRIFEKVQSFGGSVVMTSENHNTGTDRCLEALNKYSTALKRNFDVVVNIQGDEPLISPEAIKQLVNLFNNQEVEIGTLSNAHKYSEELKNPNRVKIVVDKNGKAIYFSRSIVPYVRNIENADNYIFYQHLGIYAYKTEVLRKITQLPQSMLELAESLEQNRWIENGFSIYVAETDYESIGVDVPEDLNKIIEKL